MPPMAPSQSNTVLWFTEGDKNQGISWIGQDFLNGYLAEHLNILAEAGIRPDKSQLNQLVTAIKVIIAANAYSRELYLQEIADAGAVAQKAARDHLGLGKLATKDSLGPVDVNALAKDQNLNDVPDKAKARTALQLGDSATKNTGTTAGTVAAGDDGRITGAMQKAQNGADIPNKPLFVQNLGLKETLNPTKRVSIGNIGTGAFDGSTPSINIGDSDSGFIGSADGVLDIYANNAKVGYLDSSGLHMLTDIYSGNARLTTNGDVFGSVWGNNWLSIWMTNQLNTRGTIDWINGQLGIRDNNINARATIDWVNQNFANKNTASLAVNGWFRDASTGLMLQWGIQPGGTGVYTVNLPQPFPHAGLWAMGWVSGALGYGDDDWSNSAGLLNNSQIRVTVDHGWSTAWIAIGY
ncbi:hypothetical protein CI374_15685 [Salmonella enterica subsp. enterica serovar Panama]|nr:hypothetical protein [Salmonella enterica subsp. enterica serovar Panama]